MLQSFKFLDFKQGDLDRLDTPGRKKKLGCQWNKITDSSSVKTAIGFYNATSHDTVSGSKNFSYYTNSPLVTLHTFIFN